MVALHRIDKYPQVSRGKPDELQWLDLPNNERLALGWDFFASVVPVLHDPTGTLTVKSGLPAARAEVHGTAFSVFPAYGIFVTAAHVLPEDPHAALEHNELGIVVATPSGSGVVVPVKGVSVDVENDVALCFLGVTFAVFAYPYLPLALEEPDLSDVLLVTAGFPGTQNTAERIKLWPAAYAGEIGAERLRGTFDVTHRGESRRLVGEFIDVNMTALPGHSAAARSARAPSERASAV